ncbi:hypothetical protein UWK_03404 [Desulfocapsa sulfexigens DSM 10523]|uniref:Uncharacterized protein n=2 Tax=Desulfocapsa TaxID=53318 RepID=M1PUB9_DESSD|nr:hypothetical protein UWK_03404 [Desulfocapsa sulfexigens DSM 10523]
MDERPFIPLTSDRWNILMFYNYADLRTDQDLHGLMGQYEDIVLIAWSMGVWAGQRLFQPFKKNLRVALAINGTPCPIDDQFGIAEAVVRGTLDNLNEKQRLKFYYRMCRDRLLYSRFLENQPLRSVEDQRCELGALLKNACHCQGEESIYDCALVSEHDLVMPTQNQLNYWPEKRVRRVDGSHFLFYGYGSWDEIVDGLY